MRISQPWTRSIAAFTLLGLWASAAGTQTTAAAGWTDTRVSGPFVCRADFRLDGLDELLSELAQLQTDLVRYLRIPPAGEPIELYLFRSKQTYARYVRHYFPNVPYRRALYIKGKGPGMVFTYRSVDFEVDVRHECTHALLHAVLPVVPLWLDEGLAGYFQLPAEDRAFGNPHLSSLRWNLRLGMVPRMEKLENKGSLSEMGRAEYRYSWAWVHFMLHGPPEAYDELISYLGDIRRNVPPGLLSQRLARRLSDPQLSLTAHFRGWATTTRKLPPCTIRGRSLD